MATAEANGSPTGEREDFLDSVVEFPDGNRFKRLHAITDLRKDPGEARILYFCKRTDINDSDPRDDQEYVMKIKAQWPGPQNIVHEGPSPQTAAELKVLQIFRDREMEGVPHLVTWKKTTQPTNGVHPGGYLVYTVMTRVPGQSLWDLGYWSTADSLRSQIQQSFLAKLREIRALGIAPFDCALRNVMWDKEHSKAGIVDFEHYREVVKDIDDETVELQRWGLVSRPIPGTWWQEWGLQAKEAVETGIVSSYPVGKHSVEGGSSR
ncbi:hypothetical protein LTR37_013874 [Vermiconidia calcicola]|uniref:Uncharacterized protein n=1 Tax=Vermiconidia calcicola TaxID=1690605 RepID=A0ACC3MXW1_9PEZI|nr:hypothetical protein LTR37_013874 [Vermiconidia calcicola]